MPSVFVPAVSCRASWFRHDFGGGIHSISAKALGQGISTPERFIARNRAYGVAIDGLSASLTGRPGLPRHLGIEPDRHRATTLQRVVIGAPVLDLVGRGGLLMPSSYHAGFMR